MPQVQQPQSSYLRSAEPAQQEEKVSEETKAKRERWTARQAEVLVLCGLRILTLFPSLAKVGNQSMLSWSSEINQTM